VQVQADGDERIWADQGADSGGQIALTIADLLDLHGSVKAKVDAVERQDHG